MTTYRQATTLAIRVLMTRQGVTGRAIAEHLDVAETNVSQWLSKRTDGIPQARVEDIRRFLGVSNEDIAREIR